MRKQLGVTGKTDSKGVLFLYGMDEVNDFFRKYPNCKIVGNFEVYESGASEALKGYYRNYVLIELQKAYQNLGYRYFIEEVDAELREMSVTCKKGRANLIPLEIDELSNSELIEFLDEIKQIAAEHFHTIIYDPRV